MPAESDATLTTIRGEATRLIQFYRWQSVDLATLVPAVATRLAEGGSGDRAVERACEREAAAQLYAACERGRLRTATPPDRQRAELAYQDLGNYLTVAGPRLGRLPAPGIDWASVVQDTLIAVHMDFAHCETPSAFLAWAMVILERKRLATHNEYTRRAGRETSLGADDDHQDPPTAAGGASGVRGGTASRHVDPEGDQEVYAILGECLEDIQERVVGLAIVSGLKRRELHELFKEWRGQLDYIRKKVIRHLNQCERFLRLRDPDRAEPCSGCSWSDSTMQGVT